MDSEGRRGEKRSGKGRLLPPARLQQGLQRPHRQRLRAVSRRAAQMAARHLPRRHGQEWHIGAAALPNGSVGSIEFGRTGFAKS